RLVTGFNVLNGTMDYKEFENPGAATKGPLLFSSLDKSENYSAYLENSFYFLPRVALVASPPFRRDPCQHEQRRGEGGALGAGADAAAGIRLAGRRGGDSAWRGDDRHGS